MGPFLLAALLFGLQVDHTLYAEELTGDFSYYAVEIDSQHMDGDTGIWFYFRKSYNNISIRACTPTVCTFRFKNYFIYPESTEIGTSLCIWFWKHVLKNMKLAITIWIDDEEIVEIKA